MSSHLHRIPGIRRIPAALTRVHPGVVLFDSWRGTYSDSPRAIFEELRRRELALEYVWTLDDRQGLVPEGATVIEPQSRLYLEYLGRASYIVANNTMPGYFRKKPGCIYVQTWHGTPLKRIAFDIEQPAFRGSRRYLYRLRRDVSAWDFLVSPNRFSTRVLCDAFRYRGNVLETGYPRNDVLASAEADALRARIRASLGIDDGVRAVLYVPTWRDNSSFSLQLDFAQIAHELGDRHLFLLRAHPLVAATVWPPAEAAVRDVSDYPDIRDLYLAADVLITDYSSAMFDFAVTRRPILFFTYDLERYRDEVRGFYFDFEADAPGPLLRTSSAVAGALADLDQVSRRYAPAYRRFVERFCELDDGHAAQRVVDALFGGGG